METARRFFTIGAAFGFTGVALGAFGAHSLRSSVSPEMITVFETGVRYQMYHTFALLFAAWALQSMHNRKFLVAAWMFTTGMILFSGSLYLLTLTAIHQLGMITPLGGVLLLAGWLMTGYGFWQKGFE